MVDVSVIMPCFNEKDTIAESIIAVREELRKLEVEFEIIVVDNGSVDGSDSIAEGLGVFVLNSTASTVAGVRNEGAEFAKGEVFVFLDSDIIVQSGWGESFYPILNDMKENMNCIIGSHPVAPPDIKPLLASWYEAISSDTRDTYVGTGHMILPASFFKSLGGFNVNLETGEDFDLCTRAKKMGGRIINNVKLVVCHKGYPGSLFGFAAREIWHGGGDCTNLRSILSSRVLVYGFIFLLLNLSMLVSLFLKIEFFFLLTILLVALTVTFNFYKFGFGSIQEFTYRSVVAYVYLFSRGLSLPYYIFKRWISSNYQPIFG